MYMLVRMFVGLFDHSFNILSIYPFIRSFVCAFFSDLSVCVFVYSFVPWFIH